jgi:hypothetical protein
MASTWGASLRVLRPLYTTVVCPAITTGCPTWWAPLTRCSFRERLEKSFRKLKTIASELSLEPIRPHQDAALRQKRECPHFLFTWMAGRPDSD